MVKPEAILCEGFPITTLGCSALLERYKEEQILGTSILVGYMSHTRPLFVCCIVKCCCFFVNLSF